MITPTNGMVITQSLLLAPGVYFLPDGIEVKGNNLVIEGNQTVLVGAMRKGSGISLDHCQGVTLKNLALLEYHHGIHAERCSDLTIENCTITSTAEVPANTIFLDIWLPPDQSYGGGIYLNEVQDSIIRSNTLQHQMNGLLAYESNRLTVTDNNASYCSGFGFYLSATTHSTFENNYADYCTRYQPREGGSGHMGADAAGFVLVRGSSQNIFRKNAARLSGDGFFLAGLSPEMQLAGCDENLFEENDGSWSPNIAFEATFSKGNVFRKNMAKSCNYGFWLGFSRENTLEDNLIAQNRQAGIAVENGIQMRVHGNVFQANTHGILLWSKYISAFANVVPENDTSREWLITGNQFIGNQKAIRIAADQDHGIRPYAQRGCPAPYHHEIRENQFEHNFKGIEIEGSTDNILEANLE